VKKRTIILISFLVISMFTSGCMLPMFGNEPPIIQSSPLLTATLGVTYSYQVIAVDDSTVNLTYSLVLGPDGMTINNLTGLIEWTPTESQLGENEVEIIVRDGWYKIPQEFSIEVSLLQLSSISVEPASMSFATINSTKSITSITATYSDSSSAAIDRADCIYTSDKPTIASVSIDGIVTSKSTGSAIITVSYTEDEIVKSDTVNVTVTYSPPTGGG